MAIQLSDLVKDLENLNPEKLHQFIYQMTGTLFELQEKLSSKDVRVREEAILKALEIKGSLEQEMEVLSKKLGMDASQFLKLAEMKNPDPAYASVNQEIEELKSLFTENKKDAQ